MCDQDEILRVQYVFFTMDNILGSHRIHVMDYWAIENLIAGNTEIVTFVSGYHVMSKISPFFGSIELLVHVAFETKGLLADDAFEIEILETIFEGCV
jgi:hypothetical protein